MSFPVFKRSWVIQPNEIVSFGEGNGHITKARSLQAITARMTGLFGGIASIVDSSDGVALTTSPARWVAANPDGGLVWDDEGAPHAWVQISLPRIPCELLIALEDAAGVVVIASAAGFSGGDRAHRPTALDELPLLAGEPFRGGDDDQVLHSWVATDGRAFRFLTFKGGNVDGILHVERPLVVVDGWDTPFIAKAGPGTDASLTYAELLAIDAGYKALVTRDGTAYPLAVGFTAECIGGGVPLGTALSGKDKLANAYPLGSIGLYTASTYTPSEMSPISAASRLGSLADLWWGPDDVHVGVTGPADGSAQIVQAGHVVMPWNGTASFLTEAP